MSYTPPGVNITETVNSQVSPLVASSSDVCLVGPAPDVFHVEESRMAVTTTATEIPFLTAQPSSQKASLVRVISVRNEQTPSLPEGSEGKGYKEGRDYEVNLEKGTIKRLSGTESKLTESTKVVVEFEYIPADYYNPKRLFSALEVQNRYGSAWDAQGETILSPLSMAALIAFENGASSILCQPVFTLKSGSGSVITYNTNGIISNAEKATPTQLTEKTTWTTTFEALSAVPEIEIVVPVIGQGQYLGNEGSPSKEIYATNAAWLSIIGALHGFQQNSNSEQKYIIGVFGEDSTRNEDQLAEENLVTAERVRIHAETLKGYQGGALNSQCVMINTTNFILPRPQSSIGLNVGGQYVAAAVAGALAARSASSSLTRKGIIGFVSVADLRTPQEKNKDAETGLMVIEQVANQVRCRHALTMDTSGGASRSEVSVIRAKFLMIASVKKTLEDQIIGQIIADGNSPIIVRSAIAAVLSQLQASRYLVDYQSPQVSISSIDPTVITASFAYRPAFTVNYINVNFSLNLTNQTVGSTEENSNTIATL